MSVLERDFRRTHEPSSLGQAWGSNSGSTQDLSLLFCLHCLSSCRPPPLQAQAPSLLLDVATWRSYRPLNLPRPYPGAHPIPSQPQAPFPSAPSSVSTVTTLMVPELEVSLRSSLRLSHCSCATSTCGFQVQTLSQIHLLLPFYTASSGFDQLASLLDSCPVS